ncbi:MAG: hypothetical protein EXR71_11125 [Myxococcales bacterium]|nr:hypothetical protein [Myxococcales bacterium]
MNDDTRRLMDAFERVRERPGTLELFDGVAAEDAVATAKALSRYPRHPMADVAARWLAARGVEAPGPPAPDVIMAERGIVDLAAHLDAAQNEATRLRVSLVAAFARAGRAESLASAYAAIVVLLVAVAAAGWAASFDLWGPGPPVVPPEPVARPAPVER